MKLSVYDITPGGFYTFVTVYGTYARLDASHARRLYYSLRSAGVAITILAA